MAGSPAGFCFAVDRVSLSDDGPGSVKFINDAAERTSWWEGLQAINWNVFIEGPPKGTSQPAQVIKYLASYLTGGPISDLRVIFASDQEVWIRARPEQSDQQHSHEASFSMRSAYAKSPSSKPNLSISLRPPDRFQYVIRLRRRFAKTHTTSLSVLIKILYQRSQFLITR